ncbi:hypothetical protein ACWHAO_03290 [Streptomyces albidoflavus]
MERHALVRDEVDWPKLRRNTLGRAEGASGPADTHEAIEQALRDLGDGHSTFLTPEKAARAENEVPDDQVLPQAQRLPKGLGHLTLPPIRSDTAAGPYLRAARAAVREADRTGRVHHVPLRPDVEVAWARGSGPGAGGGHRLAHGPRLLPDLLTIAVGTAAVSAAYGPVSCRCRPSPPRGTGAGSPRPPRRPARAAP